MTVGRRPGSLPVAPIVIGARPHLPGDPISPTPEPVEEPTPEPVEEPTPAEPVEEPTPEPVDDEAPAETPEFMHRIDAAAVALIESTDNPLLIALATELVAGIAALTAAVQTVGTQQQYTTNTIAGMHGQFMSMMNAGGGPLGMMKGMMALMSGTGKKGS